MTFARQLEPAHQFIYLRGRTRCEIPTLLISIEDSRVIQQLVWAIVLRINARAAIRAAMVTFIVQPFKALEGPGDKNVAPLAAGINPGNDTVRNSGNSKLIGGSFTNIRSRKSLRFDILSCLTLLEPELEIIT